MKKTILYLSITSLLTIPNTIATEVASRTPELSPGIYGLVETLQIYRAQNESLRDQLETQGLKVAMDASLEEKEREDLEQALVHMTQEMDKERGSKEALKRVVDSMKQEQYEAKQLLDQVLEELIPPYALPMDTPLREESQTPPTPPSFPLEMTKEVDLDEEETPQEATPKEETPKEATKPKEARPVKEIVTPKEAEKRKENKSLQGAQGAQGMRTPSLSTYQQTLLFQRNLIGDSAWAALDGQNPNLSARLVEAIQRRPGKLVDILYQDQHSFTLRVNGRKQDKAYKF